MKFSYAGLAGCDVESARIKCGSNVVTTQESETFMDKLKSNLKDPIIMILIVALAVTVTLAIFGFAPWYEGVGIAIAVVLATLVSTWSEYSNENEFQKLLEEASLVQVKVFRDNRLTEISINDLVVGDYLLVQPGDTIPADGFLVAGKLELNESALTGESELIKKQATSEENSDETLSAMSRAALVMDGEAVMKITAVGDQTLYGQTLKELISAEDRLSPLQEKLADLSKKISLFGYIGATFIALSFMFNHIYLQGGGWAPYWDANSFGVIVRHLVQAVVLAIIIIVVAVPEGLPMMIAVVLSLNMRKLLKAKVLVRKLLGIETAGSLTVLFSDKTGTLTHGVLTTVSFLTGNGQQYSSLDSIPEHLRQKTAFALRNSTSASIEMGHGGVPEIVGVNATEQALLRFLGPQLLEKDDVEWVSNIPFKSAYKFSAAQLNCDPIQSVFKGAAEILLSACTHYVNAEGERLALEDKTELLQEMKGLSARAMRLIAVAYSEEPLEEDQSTLPESLTLIGVFGLRDEIREAARIAVRETQQAGIRVVMITGDARDTAHAIAKELGLLVGDNPQVLTSVDLAKLSDEELKKILPQLCVVARALPIDKSRLVKAAKSLNWVVGMTGDGVNDAPAVKNADVGFSMGSGTEMTKESSDIVILDDNFASLARAVLYGRTLLKSIRKFLVFQLSVNVAAILVAFLGPFFGQDLPLTMTQLLWVNLVMDTLAAIAFSGEAALERTMKEPPVPKDAPLITADMWSAIMTTGLFMAALSMFFLNSDIVAFFFQCDPERCGLPESAGYAPDKVLLTAFFAFFVFINNFNKINSRTESTNLLDHLSENKNFIGVVSLIFVLQITFTYLGGEILRTVGLTLGEWIVILLLAVTIIPVDLARKRIRNRYFKDLG